MTWGLVLSGGVACGIANGGIIEVLEREKLRPSAVAGSSMGGIIGGLYAFGVPIEDIHALSKMLSFLKIVSMQKKPFQHGLHSGLFRQNFTDVIYPLIGDARIGDCQIPFLCIAGRVRQPLEWQKAFSGGLLEHAEKRIEKYIFPPDTKLLDALLATSAMPVLFAPVEVNGDMFVDLVNFGSIPTRTMRESYDPDRIIATNTEPGWQSVSGFLPKPLQEFTKAGYISLEESKRSCDLLIEPQKAYGPFRFDKAEAFWAAGKAEAEKRLEEIKICLSV
ncbi:MAG: patatin [Candidatus Peribacteria bacterium]|nr:patatin [Candidatus Peribacteria bacterium]